MKSLFTVLFALCALVATAQDSASSSGRDSTPPPTTEKRALKKPASSDNPTPDSAAKMNEKDYYKALYDLAKEKADQSHSDTQWGYGINITITIAIVAIILAVQIFSNKAESEYLRDKVNKDVQNLLEKTQETVLAALSEKHQENLKELEARSKELETKVTGQINQELQRNRMQDSLNQIDINTRYFTPAPPTSSAEYNSLTDPEKAEVFTNQFKLSEKVNRILQLIDSGTSGEATLMGSDLIQEVVSLAEKQEFMTTAPFKNLIRLQSLLQAKELDVQAAGKLAIIIKAVTRIQ